MQVDLIGLDEGPNTYAYVQGTPINYGIQAATGATLGSPISDAFNDNNYEMAAPGNLGNEGGVNIYAYVRGNPLNFIDPYGLAYKSPGSIGHGTITIRPGGSIGAWIVDLPDGSVASGLAGDSIPSGADVDFVYVNGRWYKIKNGNFSVGPDACNPGQSFRGVRNRDNQTNWPNTVYPVTPHNEAPPIYRFFRPDGNGPANTINAGHRRRINNGLEGLPLAPLKIK